MIDVNFIKMTLANAMYNDVLRGFDAKVYLLDENDSVTVIAKDQETDLRIEFYLSDMYVYMRFTYNKSPFFVKLAIPKMAFPKRGLPFSIKHIVDLSKSLSFTSLSIDVLRPEPLYPDDSH